MGEKEIVNKFQVLLRLGNKNVNSTNKIARKIGNSVQRVDIELQDFRSMLGLGDDKIPVVTMGVYL